MNQAVYKARIDAIVGDYAALTELADELRTVPAPWAGLLRIQVIAKRARLKASADRKPIMAGVPFNFGLPAPTNPGTPLYRFRIADSQFQQLELELTSKSERLARNPDRYDSAKFVVWAAEWFRRKYVGGMQRWADVGAVLGLRLDHFSGKRLCTAGFQYWNLPLLRLDNSTEYLASIARQAGFPIAALDGGTGGWAQNYLLFIVGRMLGNHQIVFEEAIEHALEGEGMVPVSWRGEEIRVVCAELSVAIVELRRRAESGGVSSGLLVSAWLDANFSGWRDQLPLTVDASSAGFVDGLMAAKAIKGGGGSARCSRELKFADGIRYEQIALHLNGSLKQIESWGSTENLSDEYSRLRLYATGRLSDVLPGHIAIAEPDDGGDWSTRSSLHQERVEWPLFLPVELELRGNDRRIGSTFVIPGGHSIGAGLRVWSSAAQDDATLPETLQLAGTGSGGYRSETLWLDIPRGWAVEPGSEVFIPVLAHQDENRVIWKVAGNVHVRTFEGDIFSIRAGQKFDTKDAIRLLGDVAHRLTAIDGEAPVLQGIPQVFVTENGKDRAAQRADIWWKPAKQQGWKQMGDGEPFGLTDFAWRDATSGHLRARAEAVILPENFKLNQEQAASRLYLTTSDWGGNISLSGGFRQDQEGRWVIPIDRPSLSQIELSVVKFGQNSVVLHFAPPTRAWIGKWSGKLSEKNSSIALAELSHHCARTARSTDLMADLYDGSGRHLPQGQIDWDVNGELGLATLGDDISGMLAPAGIDATVKLNFNDGHENYWYIKQFDNELVREPGYGLMPREAIVDDEVRVVGRFLGRPWVAEEFGAYQSGATTKQRIDLPVLYGPWLIYLTLAGKVITRPFLLKGKELVVSPETQLGKAMVCETGVRQSELDRLLATSVREPVEVGSPTFLRTLVELAVSLGDLPPLTFEVFGLLARQPALMPELIFACQNAQEIEQVMKLEKGLSFSWLCAPTQAWKSALDRFGGPLFDVFLKIYGDPVRAIEMVKEATRDFIQPIIDYEPALKVHFEPSLSLAAVDQVVESFLMRSGDRIGRDKLSNPFRPAHEPFLSEWPGAIHYRRAIDAPIVAALAAQGKIEPTDGQIACIKEIARRHPRYFSDCYAATIRSTT
jgi:hypothetical protein